MYSKYFGLREPSFAITPDPQYLFLSEQHREALAHLLYGAGESGGFVLLTGEVGTGKTTVCRAFLEQLPDAVDVALILNPAMTVTELLRAVCEELRIPLSDSDRSVQRLVDRLNSYLLEAHADGRRPLLMIDEAQNLRPKVLEQIRLLTNLETTKHKLLQIFLVGQPELHTLLQREGLRQLNQRITARYHLAPFGPRDTAEYVRHRLAVAGVDRQLFTRGALRRIHRFSGGVPRLINILCDRALLGAYVTRSVLVTKRIVARAAGEIRPPAPRGRRRAWGIAAGMAATLVLAIAAGWHYRDRIPAGWQPPVPAFLARWLPPHAGTNRLPSVESVPEATPAQGRPAHAVIASKAAPGKEDAAPQVALARVEPGPVQPPTLDLESIMTDESTALGRILPRWGIEPDDIGSGDPCTRVSAFGLGCDRDQGSWSTLRELDRPVAIRLRDDQGNDGFAAITGMADGTVTLALADGTKREPVTGIAGHWTGDYVVIWQPPPVGGQMIRPGSPAAAVRWLRKLLAQVPTQPFPDTGSGSFDAALAAALRRFQSAHGLAPDGIAGPQTLIRLNNVVAMPGIPRLSGAS
ncbi:MAG: AAA family ATPase [Chromatiaceae bacterium]